MSPSLHVARSLWMKSLVQLRARTNHELHESGAFLLGHIDGNRRVAREVIFFDELNPEAYASGGIELDSRHYRTLWRLAKERELQVVADIHVHPWSAHQSDIDRRNPLIATQGHLALIVPRFARPPVRRWALGIYEYDGDHQWRAHGGCRNTVLHVENDDG